MRAPTPRRSGSIEGREGRTHVHTCMHTLHLRAKATVYLLFCLTPISPNGGLYGSMLYYVYIIYIMYIYIYIMLILYIIYIMYILYIVNMYIYI